MYEGLPPIQIMHIFNLFIKKKNNMNTHKNVFFGMCTTMLLLVGYDTIYLFIRIIKYFILVRPR